MKYDNFFQDLPKHKCGLYLDHNPQEACYETVDEWIGREPDYDWETDAAKKLAIATNSVWTLQWYPDTPIGFFNIASPTLEGLLKYANKIQQEEKQRSEPI